MLNSAAAITPKELKRKSIQSPPRYRVSTSCKSSITPLNTMGPIMAPQNMFFTFMRRWVRKYSNHSITQNPPYINRCAILSISLISFSAVLGGLKKDRYIITANIIIDRGYLFKILSILSIIIGIKGKIVIFACSL